MIVERATQLIFIIFIVSIVTSSIDGIGDTNPFNVVIIIQDRDYSIGDTIMVHVHIFRHSKHIDVDSINFEIGINDRQHVIERVSVGLYYADVEILEEDLTEDASLRISVRAMITDPVPEEGSDYIWVHLSGGSIFRLDFVVTEPSDRLMKPGQTMEFVIVCRYGDGLVDPDDGSLLVYVKRNPEGSRWNVRMDRLSIGIYRGNWTMPIEINVSSEFIIDGTASYNASYPTQKGHFIPIYFSPFDIWYNYISVNKQEILLDIYHHTWDRAPIASNKLDINITDSSGNGDRIESSITPIDNGVSRLRITINNLDYSPNVIVISVLVNLVVPKGFLVSPGDTGTKNA